MTTQPTDWRALCIELLGKYDLEWRARERLKEVLAQPEPEGLTLDCDDIDVPAWHRGDDFRVYKEGYASGWSDAVIAADRARWGRPAVEPVPVSKRLPREGDCDANGHCWCGTRASIDRTGDLPVEMPSSWELREPCAQDDCVLPHHALPIPTTPTETSGKT